MLYQSKELLFKGKPCTPGPGIKGIRTTQMAQGMALSLKERRVLAGERDGG